MNYKEEETITSSVLHVMNFIIIELLRHGFLLAMENELKDLKALVKAEEDNWLSEGDEPISISAEIELLRSVEDIAVKHIVSSIDKLCQCCATYEMINNLDLMEVINNDDFNEVAETTYHYYAFKMECDGTYESILDKLHWYYEPIDIILFHCIMQFVHNKIEVYEETTESYCHYYNTRGYEILTDNKNALLLLDLLPELNKDAGNIDEYQWTIIRKNEHGNI